jgi:hypothetical protein
MNLRDRNYMTTSRGTSLVVAELVGKTWAPSLSVRASRKRASSDPTVQKRATGRPMDDLREADFGTVS